MFRDDFCFNNADLFTIFNCFKHVIRDKIHEFDVQSIQLQNLTIFILIIARFKNCLKDLFRNCDDMSTQYKIFIRFLNSIYVSLDCVDNAKIEINFTIHTIFDEKSQFRF